MRAPGRIAPRTAMNIAPGIAAFFDLDGTLLAPPSLERRFVRYLRWRGELTIARQGRCSCDSSAACGATG